MPKKMLIAASLMGCSFSLAVLAAYWPDELRGRSDRRAGPAVQLPASAPAAFIQISAENPTGEAHASEMLDAVQEQVRKQAGGYGPGVHIVPDAQLNMPVKLAPGQTKSSVIKDSLAGVRTVADGVIFDFKGAARSAKPGFRPASELAGDKSLYIDRRDIRKSGLKDSMLRSYTYSGTFLQGPDGIKDAKLRRHFETPTGRTGWTGLLRLFDGHPVLGAVLFQESDVAAAKGTVLIPESAINMRVLEFPATLSRKQDAAGRTMSEISWAEEGRRIYSLSAGAVDDGSVSALRELAEAAATR
jgi:hypothetical protein